ncbi:hypothetical protein BJ508DRAFT_411496 [Ascobolus immersus RN42]|uniref:CHY-type domain-containing protein n=1 Tax=Ascobolus immersus RN42 TaxID=1160509 RepID=A0A3N4IXE7_ASCIM|nr:hypothetical protein BJ508DRAFT_411496 [Ascobolus immersus RN42]
MCKHVLNAQVAIRSHCCKKWFDCAECHAEKEDHPLMKKAEMIFACKKCKKVFRKDGTDWDESDEYCPYCDNHFVIDALTPKAELRVEMEDPRIDNRALKDERVAGEGEKILFSLHDQQASKLG